jgi:hypothetical protein
VNGTRIRQIEQGASPGVSWRNRLQAELQRWARQLHLVPRSTETIAISKDNPMATKKKGPTSVKPTVKKRSLNAAGAKPAMHKGDAFSNQDAKRRMGTFESAGEHALVGGRGSGIVGQTTKRFRTDNRKQKP